MMQGQKNIKLHLTSKTPFFFENPARKNVVERSRSQMIIWCNRITCWIPKATNADTGCVILIAFPLQQLLHERAPMLRYTYIACLDRWHNIIIQKNNVRVKVILGCVRVTIVAVESSKYYIFRMSVCNLIQPACKTRSPYDIVICGMSVSAIFFHIIS